MSEKHTPEALRLADAIGGWHAPAHASIADCDQVADLLRTQHALLKQARATLSHSNPSEPIWKTPHRETLAALNQHLDQP